MEKKKTRKKGSKRRKQRAGKRKQPKKGASGTGKAARKKPGPKLTKPERDARDQAIRWEWATNPQATTVSLGVKHDLHHAQISRIVRGRTKAVTSLMDAQGSGTGTHSREAIELLESRRRQLELVMIEEALLMFQKIQEKADRLEQELPWFEKQLKKMRKRVDGLDPFTDDEDAFKEWKLAYSMMVGSLGTIQGIISQVSSMHSSAVKASQRAQVFIDQRKVTLVSIVLNTEPGKLQTELRALPPENALTLLLCLLSTMDPDQDLGDLSPEDQEFLAAFLGQLGGS